MYEIKEIDVKINEYVNILSTANIIFELLKI